MCQKYRCSAPASCQATERAAREAARVRWQLRWHDHVRLGEEPGARRVRCGDQARVGGQDALLQPPQVHSRLDAEILGQLLIGLLVGTERIGLPAAPVKREHLQAAQPLPVGVLGDQLAEGRDDLGVPAGVQVKLHAILGQGEPQLFQPGGDGRDRCHLRESGVSGSAP